MAEYKHGAYAQINANGSRAADKSRSIMVYVGTAPVNTVAGGAKNVNVPILVNNIAEARRYLGYSDDWAKYTLCEAMHHHLETKGVGPLVFINVLDPKKHKSKTTGNVTKKAENGRVTIPSAGDIILDSIVVKAGSTPKTAGTDYSVAYNVSKEMITISEAKNGALGSTELTITYDLVDATAVTEEDVIGASDGLGLNTGIYAIKNVYQMTKCIPAFLVCPGFSSNPTVHSEMVANAQKINGHWDAFCFSDMPIVADGNTLTPDKAYMWKKAHGYNRDNEKAYYPMISGIDGKKYHISVLAAANMQELLRVQDGIPYKSSSNTACDVAEGLYIGEDFKGRVLDDSIINEHLNKNGISSAAYAGGRWALWGAHAASYDQDNGDQINVAETNRMMLYYISNDFQARRMLDVDKPKTANDIRSIVSEEQARLDALVKIGALIYGEVRQDVSADAKSDVINGDYAFTFDVTTTPLAKSLTAVVSWTDDGFATYFADGSAD